MTVARQYRKSAVFTVGLILYFAIAGGNYLLDQPEVFPFAPFALYSHADRISADYTIEIQAVNGNALDEPLYYQEAGGLYDTANDVTAQTLMNSLGEAFADEDDETALDLRRTIEELYLLTDDVTEIEYTVVERRFDAIERYRTGEFIEEQAIAGYRADGTGRVDNGADDGADDRADDGADEGEG